MKIDWLQIAPFIAAGSVQLVCIPVQSAIAKDLRRFHVRNGTRGVRTGSTPDNIKSKFFIDSDFLTAFAAVITFYATMLVTLFATKNYNLWIYATYTAVSLLFLLLCLIIYNYYRKRYNIYLERSIRRKVTILGGLVLSINTLGVLGCLIIANVTYIPPPTV